ncbi:hypothetical protein CAC42_2610 [Sphaceloma murrayae]|uniref:Thioredoxin-like protein AAED1 n=1 Tax=Sphaceloma murrayae TaxID=2082308 RepID=A0A2K1QI81_9PEZI|nr:hypothetical protein CAC42_2610 [Sphaceloma murrayae]
MSWLISTDGTMTPEEQSALPSEKSIEKLLSLDVKAEDGSSVNFKSLVNDPSHPRVLVVFVRHFFCGFCEEYVRALMKDVPPATLSAATPPTKLVLIGCGDSTLISDYKKRTGCAYDMYADSSRATYDSLGFAVTLANNGRKQPEYSDRSFGSVVVSSFMANLTAGVTKLFSGGKTNQNGGELVWEGGELKFIHRMAGTTDHMGLPALKQQLGM